MDLLADVVALDTTGDSLRNDMSEEDNPFIAFDSPAPADAREALFAALAWIQRIDAEYSGRRGVAPDNYGIWQLYKLARKGIQ